MGVKGVFKENPTCLEVREGWEGFSHADGRVKGGFGCHEEEGLQACNIKGDAMETCPIQVNSRGSCSNLVNKEISRPFLEAGLRPFKDNVGSDGSLGLSLGQALAVSSKAPVESQARPSMFGSSLPILVKQPIGNELVLNQDGFLSPFIVGTFDIPLES